ncbi:hypothetical protein RGUI_4299 (plasmid) [Rhodovulum sp. P5]|uniref:FAD/NAD(P)-binding protein n=1 Tax=Rhodovulum sp. P5 TaxID=1564506 RepID=UPI0009C24177|nr:FAD/NAD(P)-binding domain-containing protein [Rhodovulum sp. P5]ARE42325.1 hypothetical protein RGUI_4299 [Rhodovulum sp. P5]
MHTPGTIRIAVIGAGPRGLGALEALAARLPQTGTTVEVEIFDPDPHPGAGPNFDPTQSPLALLNLPVRSVSLRQREGLAQPFPDFAQWRNGADDETFPPRADLGAYLNARLTHLRATAPAGMRLRLRDIRVDRIDPATPGWRIAAGGTVFGPFDEVLIAPGQPDTAPDPQIARWRDHADRHGLDLLPAYPDAALRAAAEGWAGRKVAVRGLGLSTLDVLRFLTLGLGGRIEDGRYIASGREPARIFPFSLDGQPPMPKPADAAQDARYDPLPAETDAFETALARAIDSPAKTALPPIAEALRRPAERILQRVGGDVAAARPWLETECTRPGTQETRAPADALAAGIAMARGQQVPSAGYVIGQVWRKWQDAFRRGFNTGGCAPDTAAALIGFDEGLKRYSYGPPVSSAEELRTLIAADRVQLCVVDDPDICLVPEGWQLQDGTATTCVSAMVDAVLPAPALEGLAAPALAALRDGGVLSPVADGLGARTDPDAQVIGTDGAARAGLCLLGRPALGSTAAVDSIHDCFGASADRWAAGVVHRADARRPASVA